MEEEAQLARGLNPPEQHRLWRDVILPRTVIPLYWAYKIALVPSYLFGVKPGSFEKVAIESGKIGWTHVAFEEFLGSARDYFGEQAVSKQVVDRDAKYFPQFKRNQQTSTPDLLVIDVRTTTQSWRATLVETFQMSRLINQTGITPIVVLTDAYFRRHRWQAAVLTAYRGSVVTFSAKQIVRKIFPHNRITGPLFMPISKDRLAWLEKEKANRDMGLAPSHKPNIAFIGSMYSPRQEFLQIVKDRLAKRGIDLKVNGDKAGTSNDQYWRTLVEADIILTTTLQGPERKYIDWSWVRQAVFRYSETLAAGTTLVAGPVDGGFPYFQNGGDYIQFESVDECVNAIVDLVDNPEKAKKIARQGHATVAHYVKQGTFWKVAVDAANCKNLFKQRD